MKSDINKKFTFYTLNEDFDQLYLQVNDKVKNFEIQMKTFETQIL